MLPTTAISLVIAGCVALIAVATDLQSRRIPNWLTLSALLAGLVIQTVQNGAMGIVIGFAGAGLAEAPWAETTRPLV